jgi:hypothetical protein
MAARALIDSREVAAASALRREETGRSQSNEAGVKAASSASWLIRQGENAARQI